MILLFSICLHFLFLYSVFDLHFRVIHFTSAPACERNLTRLTKRVVLAVSDGLSAELIYTVLASRGKNYSFLRRVMEEEGTWGLSNTSIPSCSKSGFLSMTSGTKYDSFAFLNDIGLYPFKHVRLNKIDSIFYSGDPYVPSYTSNTDEGRRWTINTWPEGFEDTEDYSKFDNFAYDGINKSFFMKKSLKARLNADKVIFILWSPSMDYCDHPHRPKHCASMVENVDRNIEKLDSAFRSYYGDNKTTFIFTCGHGRTESENACPFIAWGPGIRKGGGITREMPKNWKTENMKSVNIEQIDIAVLITTLLGDPTPTHSSGIVQKDVLDTDDTNIQDALYCNQQQMYHLLEEHAKTTGDYSLLEKPGGENITDLVHKLSYSYEQELAEKLIRIHQKQLVQYKRYFNLFLWKIVTMIYLGWGILILERQFKQTKNRPMERCRKMSSRIQRWYVKESARKDIFSCLLDFIAFVFCISLVILVFLKNWPMHLSVYFTALCLVWWRVFKNIKSLTVVWDNFNSFANTAFCMMATTAPLCGIIFGIARVNLRQILIIITTIALIFTMKLKTSDIIISILSSLIILLSFIYEIICHDVNPLVVAIGCLSWICFLLLYIYYKDESVWSFLYFFILTLSVWNVITLRYFPQAFTLAHSVLAWCVLTFCLVLPHCSKKQGVQRLFHFFFSFGATFILMCVRLEALGLLGFCLHLSIWLSAELRESKTDGKVDVRRGFLLLFYIYTGHFIIGSTDYPNSFYIDWSYSFIPHGQQSIIAALQFYKTMIPQFLLAAMFAIVCGRNQKPFEWFMFLNNIVSLVLFLSTKGEGYRFEEISDSLFRFTLSLFFPVFFTITVPLFNSLTNCVTK